jgi:hypothetical protein
MRGAMTHALFQALLFAQLKLRPTVALCAQLKLRPAVTLRFALTVGRNFSCAILCALLCVAASAEERQWQSGTWRDSKIERPKVMFSVQSRDPNSNLPRTAAAREIRTFLIDTSTHRLELRQDATVDTPHIDVVVGQPVQLAIEKNTVYVKDGLGKEHKLSLRKRTTLER